jgi:hypothetical protein
LKLEGGFLNVSPRRYSDKAWNFPQRRNEAERFYNNRRQRRFNSSQRNFRGTSVSGGRAGNHHRPKKSFECNDWEKINSYSEALMVTRKDPRHDTICHIYANPFEFNAALIAPDLGGVDRRSSAVGGNVSLRLHFFDLCLFILFA